MASVNRDGLRWRDAPVEYGPSKTLYNRWVRWGGLEVLARMLTEMAAEGQNTETVVIDATHLKAHRTASSLRGKKRGVQTLHRRTKSGTNSKLHVVTDSRGRPICIYPSAGQPAITLGLQHYCQHCQRPGRYWPTGVS